MNKVYLIAPLIGMLIFAGIHAKYSRLHAARVAESDRQIAIAKAEKRAEDEAAKTRAVELARIYQTKRNEERAEKERSEALQKQARLTLEEQRNLAIEEVGRLRPQLERLRRELDAAVTAVEHSEQRARLLEQEEQKIRDGVERAEANRKILGQLLDRLESIEQALPASAHSASDTKPRQG